MTSKINRTRTPLAALLAVAAIAVTAMLTIAPASVIGSAGAASNAVALDMTAAACEPKVIPLTAGQHINVGTVTIWNDNQKLYVKYDLHEDSDCTFGTLHLWVGNDLANIPKNPEGTPVPGHFPYKPDATGLTSYTITVPLAPPLVDQTTFCGTNLFVVAHAEVTCGGNSETAFGGNTGVNIDTPGRWYFYDDYKVCCEDPVEPVETCETAFAKGSHVFTTDKKSNPEKLPSLNLTKNRWGWAINITSNGTTTHELWAGAGLNNTLNGTLVGSVTIEKDLAGVTVTYNTTSGSMSELHIYVGASAPTKLAPGQYGHTAYFDPKATTYSHRFEVTGNSIWIIAHAVVCTAASE